MSLWRPSAAAPRHPVASSGHVRPRAGSLAPANVTGSPIRAVPSAAQPEDRGSGSGSGGGSSGGGTAGVAPPSTLVVPSSDLQTRQLRLLPWQTSASTGAGSVTASEDLSGGSSSSSSEADAAARRASGAAASTSGSKAQQQRQLQKGSGRGQSRSIAAATSGAGALASGGSMDLAPVTPAAAAAVPPVAAAGPRAGLPCEACGGKRVVLSARGVQPCYACQQWRQRPDYRPGGSLLTLKDVNLAALDSGSLSADDGAAVMAAPAAAAAAAATAAAAPAAGAAPALASSLSSMQSSDSDSEGEGGGAAGRRRNFGRKAGPMSAERKAAISRALQSKGAKSEEHKRSIARAMREAHARNPRLRHSAAGQKKKCGHCGQEGHNRRACPQLLAGAEAVAASLVAARQAQQQAGVAGQATNIASSSSSSAAAAAAAAAEAGPPAAAVPELPAAPSRVILIEEVDSSPVPAAAEAEATATAAAQAAAAEDGMAAAPASSSSSSAATLDSGEVAATAAAAVTTNLSNATSANGAADRVVAAAPAAPALPGLSSSRGGSAELGQAAALQSSLLSTLPLGPGVSLCPEGSWVFPLPQSKEECVAQAAQASLRAWDDGIRRQTVELLLPQARPTEDGGWPGGIRQQFRVAKPMVESLLLRLKEHAGLEGRITAEFLDEGDCVGAWQSERLAAVLFPTADTLPDLRRIDDALSGNRLTLVINPQWQMQGQIISDFGIGKARKSAERFVAALEEVYYLRRVRVFGDDVRIMRCYPGQWQVHYVPPGPRGDTVLLSCEDRKPTFQTLIELLKGVQGSRASKSWLDRFLTSSMGTFNEFAAYSPEEAAAAAAATAAAAAAAGLAVGAASAGAASAEAAAAAGRQQLGQAAGAGAPVAGAAEAAAAAEGGAGAGAGDAEAGLLRDIVTGEVLSSVDDPGAGGPGAGLPAGAGFAAARREGKPVRDIRLEPVNQIARWLGGSPPERQSGSDAELPPRPRRRRRSDGSGGSAQPEGPGSPPP